MTDYLSVRKGTEFQINTYTAGDQFDPSVTSLSDGGFVVTWTSVKQDGGSSGGVYGQRYTAIGASVGDEFQINTYTRKGQGDPSVTSLSDGGFVVTWRSNGQDGNVGVGGIYGQVLDANAIPEGLLTIEGTPT